MQEVTSRVVEINAKRADETPKIFIELLVRYILTGCKLERIKVERAEVLSTETYCSASIMLRKTREFLHEIAIVVLTLSNLIN